VIQQSESTLAKILSGISRRTAGGELAATAMPS
jgi:hypothetical protein